VLWPIDLINLPRRGPYPELKPETRLTVMVLDDFGIPTKSEVQHQPEMISKYNYADPTPQAPALVERSYAQPPPQQAAPVQQPYYQPSYYPQPNPSVVVVQSPAPAVQQAAVPVVVQQPPAVYGYPPVVYRYPPPPAAYGYPPPGYRYYLAY
jgi:hypothetical protein